MHTESYSAFRDLSHNNACIASIANAEAPSLLQISWIGKEQRATINYVISQVPAAFADSIICRHESS